MFEREQKAIVNDSPSDRAHELGLRDPLHPDEALRHVYRRFVLGHREIPLDGPAALVRLTPRAGEAVVLHPNLAAVSLARGPKRCPPGHSLVLWPRREPSNSGGRVDRVIRGC